jgi:L-asparaginase
MKLLFIQTGGTIDKDYPKSAGAYPFVIARPAVGRILEKANPVFSFKVLPLLQKDSLDLTDGDRKRILKVCLGSTADKIVITHGTDTFHKTARALSRISNKTIILTGAAVPERFYNSDAVFNIGVAVGAIQALPCGIYIAMNGLVYPWRKCKKNPKTGKFTGVK